MKCQRCEVENPDDARRCQACGRIFRRRPEAEEAPPTPEAQAFFRRARWVYFWALWSMLPPTGVVLGPLAAVLACRVWRDRQADWPGGPTLAVSLCLGLLSGVTQALGVWLIVANW